MEWQPIRNWYADFFSRFNAGKQTDGPTGFCTITGRIGPLPTSHPIKLTGIPGGLPTGVSIVSFDKAAFQHYGLDGAANAAIGYEAADGYARGFQWLRGQRDHHFVLGGTLFLFWTREPANTEFMMALGEASAEQVKGFLEGIVKGKTGDAISDLNEFFLLGVSGNSARAIVREYLERPLGKIREAIGDWFNDLSIADASKEHEGQPNAAFPLWTLANATALEADRVAPDTHTRLMHAALTGLPLPDSLLAACLQRLRAEGRNGFRAVRMALIKLLLLRKEITVNPSLDTNERHPAYICGRLLAVFEQVQYAALGDVNASVVDKFFGTFSCAPAVVMGRLFANSQNHLRKLRSEKPGVGVNMDKRLSEVSALLVAPPARLSLLDQGRFALGYYHEKARGFAESAERRAARASIE